MSHYTFVWLIFYLYLTVQPMEHTLQSSSPLILDSCSRRFLVVGPYSIYRPRRNGVTVLNFYASKVEVLLILPYPTQGLT
ncbi:hypothetical protein EDB86DRAFT_2958595 [Lactarius hatsudake]|nr:hypothetical protein EDB86DRAFT_2958595 [Lactarius hatsudake]